MSRHVLVVEPDAEYAARFPDFAPEVRWRIECPDGNGCSGWIECDGNHEGFDPEDEDSPAYDEYEDVEIHGVLHAYQWGYGWTTPLPEGQCVVGECQPGIDPPEDLWQRDEQTNNLRLPLGRWVVEDEWDDTNCTLLLVGPEADR